MINNDKYVVFRKSEFDRMMQALHLEAPASVVNHIRGQALDDAIVIRKKDTFAPTALYAYATGVLSAIEIMENTHSVIPDPGTLDHLRDLADFFASQADDARQLHGRIPD